MIHWSNGEEVKAKIKGIRDYENIELTLNRTSSNSDQVELIDKSESLYYVNKEFVDYIIPEDLNPNNMKDIMIIGPEDMYKEPPRKPEVKRIVYRPKTYKSDRSKQQAFKRK